MEDLCIRPEWWCTVVVMGVANAYFLISLFITGAQRMRSAMANQGQLQAAQGQGQIQQGQGGCSPPGGSTSGAGSVSGAESEDACCGTDPEPDGSAVQVKSRQGTVDFSEQVQTILDTGEIKLVKAMQKTTETQTDFSPVWFFGFDPAANQVAVPATVTTPDGTVVAVEEPERRDIPAVDLSRFNQFSVIHYSDTRDPDNRKLVMIQTPGSKMFKPEELCSENLSVQNSARLGVDSPKSSRRQLYDRKSKSLDNSALSALMANRPHEPQPSTSNNKTGSTENKDRTHLNSTELKDTLHQDSAELKDTLHQDSAELKDTLHQDSAELKDKIHPAHESVLRRQERVGGEAKHESGDESAASHDGDSSLRDPDLDSGIWDMVHGRDTRLSSRDVTTPATSPNPCKDQSEERSKDKRRGEDQKERGAAGGEIDDEEFCDSNGNMMPEDTAATFKEMYEQMGMSMEDSERPTMSYRVFHIEDQQQEEIDGDVTPEALRVESPVSDGSSSPQPLTASTPQPKSRPEVHVEHLGASYKDDQDSDLGTDLRSNDSTADDVFAEELFPSAAAEQAGQAEDSGYLFDKIPAMQGSLIHSPVSPGTPQAFPHLSVSQEQDDDAALSGDDITPTESQNDLGATEETISVQKAEVVESSAPLSAESLNQLAPAHPSLPNRDSVESTDTVTDERIEEVINQLEGEAKQTERGSPPVLQSPPLPSQSSAFSPPIMAEDEHELSMTESATTETANTSGFTDILFDEQESALEEEVEPVNVTNMLQTEKKMVEMASPSSWTGEEDRISVVISPDATGSPNGDVYESCEEGLDNLVTVETIITETITKETVTTRTVSPAPSRRGSTSDVSRGETPPRKAPPKDTYLRRSSRPSPLNSPTTSTPKLGSPRSKPSSPLARTFASSGSGFGYGSSTPSPEHVPERGCVVHRTGARPKLLPTTTSMSPRRSQQPPSYTGLQSIFSDEPGTLINGYAAEQRVSGSKGGDDVYLVNRDGTLSDASSRTSGGVTHRSGARPKSTSLTGRPGSSDLQGLQGLNSLLVRSTSSSVVHSHVITELTAARTRLHVPELRRTPDRHSLASSDSEYASVDSSLATSPTSTSVEELASVGSDTCLLAEVMPVANYPDWMGNLPKRLHGVPLTQLAIPGSNISFAIESEMRTDMSFSKCNLEMAEFLRKLPPLAVFDNFRKIMKDIWRAWMPKQILSIAKQLEAGVRYLDIHITRYRGTFYGEHGLYTRSLKHYLRHVEEFIQQHPKEVVILHFQRLVNLTPKDKRSLVTLLFQFFGAKLCRVMDPEHLTLEELWLSKKQILAVFPDADMPALSNHIFAGLIWSSKIIRSSLPRKKTTDELMTYLESVYDEQREPDEFHVLQAVVSPDMSMVFGDYLHKSMRSLTLCETSPYLKVWLAGKEHLNIVTVDFVGIYDLTGEIIQLNEYKKAVTVV